MKIKTSSKLKRYAFLLDTNGYQHIVLISATNKKHAINKFNLELPMCISHIAEIKEL